ncbi:MAG: hypothetical protein M1829_001261 [Trizodia sp. TS-e1964]|nr:MAG: hypothetical protein M1829_001261 [Trizodia sp. TS-e1964]
MIETFAVEQWLNTHETSARYNLAETCCASISLADLHEFSKDKSLKPLSLDVKLGYGPIRGSLDLRREISNQYLTKGAAPQILPDNILATPGAIAANFIVLYSLLTKGDHVICMYPTYQQLYSVPESLGAEVSLWRLREDNQFVPCVEELRALIRPNTKLIIINNPNNPTGAITPQPLLLQIVNLAREHGIMVLSDEVYRPLFHSLPSKDVEAPSSIITMGYKRCIATGSFSKVSSLAGIRVGWIASPDGAIVETCAQARDYTTISISQIDDQIATYALSCAVAPQLFERNTNLAIYNLVCLEHFLTEFQAICSWVKPVAGTTAFIKFRKNEQPVNDEELCEDILQKTGVLIVPGSKCFGGGIDFRGYVRIGYACETEIFNQGLLQIGEYLRTTF